MSLDTKQLIQPIIDRKRLVEPMPIKSEHENPFIGMDGRDYHTFEALQQADDIWRRQHYKFMGADGKEYETFEAMQQANRAYRNNLVELIPIKSEHDIEKLNKKDNF